MVCIFISFKGIYICQNWSDWTLKCLFHCMYILPWLNKNKYGLSKSFLFLASLTWYWGHNKYFRIYIYMNNWIFTMILFSYQVCLQCMHGSSRCITTDGQRIFNIWNSYAINMYLLLSKGMHYIATGRSLIFN